MFLYIFVHHNYTGKPLRFKIPLLVSFLFFFHLCIPASAIVAIPEGYTGIWSGNNGVQINPSRSFTMRFGLIAGTVGQVVGTVEYPSLSCGGEVILKNVAADSIELTEIITYGSCLRNGIITLSLLSDGTLSYQWRSTSAATTATGTVAIVGTTGSAVSTTYTGVWRGQGSGLGGGYTILATIVPSNNNAISGAIIYPSLACGGTWRLQSTATTSIAVFEDLDYGVGRCVDNGTVTLISQSDGVLRYEWRSGGRVDTGQLYRISGVQEWADLEQLRQDLRNKDGTNDELYAHFWLCLNESACRDYEQNGASGVTAGFNKYMFDYMNTHNAGNRGSDFRCGDNFSIANAWEELSCFEDAGLHHFETELRPGFMSYCYNRQVDFDAWDTSHQNFVTNINLPCFDTVLDDFFSGLDGELYPPPLPIIIKAKAKSTTLDMANQLREEIQAECAARRQILDSDIQAAERGEENVFPVYPSPLTREQLFSEELAANSTLKVIIGDDFFLSVGSSFQISVTKITSNGQIIDLTPASTGTSYQIAVANDAATITANGLLSVVSSPSPFTSSRPLLRIIASNGNDWGIGQFAIVDVDNDSDLLNDSYELAFGLDPNQPNDVTSDTDSDNLSDRLELVLNTNPTIKDSDGDGYNDETEVKARVDPMDFRCRPFIGCQTFLYLPLVQR